MRFRGGLAVVAAAALASPTASPASSHGCGADEHVAIPNGISPDGRPAIAVHGGGGDGDDDFRTHLFDASAGKKISALEKIAGTSSVGVEAFASRWNEDSEAAAIFRWADGRAPLAAATYRFAKGSVDLSDEAPIRFWQEYGSGRCSGQRMYGTLGQRP